MDTLAARGGLLIVLSVAVHHNTLVCHCRHLLRCIIEVAWSHDLVLEIDRGELRLASL